MVAVRRAAPHELEEVGRLTAEAYLADGFVTTEDDYLAELTDAVSRDRDAEVYVAVEADRSPLLGSVTYCPPGTPYAELSQKGEGEFRMLAVAPQARGRGVAEALVRRCLDRSRELDHHRVVICSMEEMTTAHRLYRRLGFERLPERDWSPERDIRLWAFAVDLD